eukprot:9483631-Pyramimonas_sp.AAC.1
MPISWQAWPASGCGERPLSLKGRTNSPRSQADDVAQPLSCPLACTRLGSRRQGEPSTLCIASRLRTSRSSAGNGRSTAKPPRHCRACADHEHRGPLPQAHARGQRATVRRRRLQPLWRSSATESAGAPTYQTAPTGHPSRTARASAPDA